MLKNRPLLILLTLLTLLTPLILSACAAPPPPKAPHHVAGGGFQNTYGPNKNKSLWRFLKMRMTTEWADHEAEGPQVPRVPVDLKGLKAEGVEQVTWLGHSCFLVQRGGVNLLTDPVLSERASPVSFAGPKRYTPAPLKAEQLPPIHAVIISHNHYDHLDTHTIARVEALSQPLWFVPLANRELLEDEGVAPERIVELDWWEAREVRLPLKSSQETPSQETASQEVQQTIRFALTPAQHWSARGLFDRFEALWGSWSVRFGGSSGRAPFKLYFAGDTGFQRALFEEIGRREGPFDLALIPIGAYAPRDFMSTMHVNPSEAVEIHTLTRSARSIGMHWGTFPLTAEPVMEPTRKLAEARSLAKLPPKAFSTLALGESVGLNLGLNPSSSADAEP